MKRLFFQCMIFLCAGPVSAQFLHDQEPLVTDRPGEGTDAAAVVAPTKVQIEMGFLFQQDNQSEQKLALYPTTLVRVGLIEGVELRANLDVFQEGANSPTYFSPLTLGTKVHLTDNQGWIPQAALMVNVTLADMGSEEVQAQYAQPQVKLLMNNTLTEKLALTTNLGIAWENDLPHPVQSYAASLDISLSDYISPFAEFYGFWSRYETVHLFNAGTTILLLPDFQLDIAGGLGISGNAPDFYLGGGISVRF